MTKENSAPKPLAPEAATKPLFGNKIRETVATLKGKSPEVAPGEAVRDATEADILRKNWAAAVKRCFELEAQVRELTAERDELKRAGIACGCTYITGDKIGFRNHRAEKAEDQLAELRSTVERLEGAAQAQLQNLENWEISYNKLYERATMLERDLADRKKGL